VAVELDIDRGGIRAHAIRALKAADALRVVPTPIDQVREAVHLVDSSDFTNLTADMPLGLKRRILALGRRKLRGLLAVREKTVYIDPNLRHSQSRFVTGHEIGHFWLPWQQDAYRGDTDSTLAPSTKDLFEREANAFSAELLFNIDELQYRACGSPLSLVTPVELHQQFDASLIATTRRYVEQHRASCALLLIGQRETTSLRQPASTILFGVESDTFREQLGPVCKTLRLPKAWPRTLHSLAEATYEAVRGWGPPLRHGRYVAVTGNEFLYEVYAARPFPFVLLTPRRLWSRPARTQVKWTGATVPGETQARYSARVSAPRERSASRYGPDRPQCL
jgi:hypothetical protein